MQTDKNIRWINYARALCTLFIFFIHSASYYGYSVKYVESFITPIYVNTFFFISGYLLFRKQLSSPMIEENYKQYIHGGGCTLLKSIFYKIAVPSVLFSIVEFVPSYLLRKKEFGASEFLFKTIGGGTYWFTSALVVCEIIFLIVLLSRGKGMAFYFIASAILFAVGRLLCNLENVNIVNYWAFKQGFLSTIFLSSGGIYWKFEAYLKKIPTRIISLILWILYFTLVVSLKQKSKVLISICDINIVGVFVSVVGILALIKTCELFGRVNVLDYIGKNTIVFYFMSGSLPIVLSMIIKKIMVNVNMIGLSVVYIASLFIAFLVTMVINRFLPFLLDLRVLRKSK